MLYISPIYVNSEHTHIEPLPKRVRGGGGGCPKQLPVWWYAGGRGHFNAPQRFSYGLGHRGSGYVGVYICIPRIQGIRRPLWPPLLPSFLWMLCGNCVRQKRCCAHWFFIGTEREQFSGQRKHKK
jgi:hypothetical protein